MTQARRTSSSDPNPPAHGSRQGASRRWARAVPVVVLFACLATLLPFGGDRGYFYRDGMQSWMSARWLAFAENLTATQPLQMVQTTRRNDGTLRHEAYNRFPIGGTLLIKLAGLPFQDNLKAQIWSARLVVLGCYFAGALLAHLALVKILGAFGNARAIALGTTLLAFSSYHMLRQSDAIATEAMVDLFAVLLVFHGMVAFEFGGRRRFPQLLAKTAVALTLGWHVLGLLLPFIALGIVKEAARAWRRTAGSRLPGPTIRPAPESATPTASPLLRPAASLSRLLAVARAAARSRYLPLALVALLVGAGVLGYNLFQERAALPNSRPFLELPTVRSALRRTGLNAAYDKAWKRDLAWGPFLQWQLHRVGMMSAPYALTAPVAHFDEMSWRRSERTSLAWFGGLATAACGVGLMALRRRRLLLATLTFAGFCWALPMRGNTVWAGHDHESLFYLGVPLVLFALAPLTLRVRLGRRRARPFARGFAAVAALLFLLSSYRMGAAESRVPAAKQHALLAEFQTIRQITRGRDVLVVTPAAALGQHLGEAQAFHYYMAGSVLRYPPDLAAAAAWMEGDRPDFILSLERAHAPGLLTPEHRFAFLYAATGHAASAGQAGAGDPVVNAIVAARHDDYRAYAARPVLAAADYALHLIENQTSPTQRLALLKAPCGAADTRGHFTVRSRPVDKRALSLANRPRGYDEALFPFPRFGHRFDDKCLILVPLADYAIATITAAQYAPRQGRPLWQVSARVDRETLRQAHASAKAATPAARGAFNVFENAGSLTYVREPCEPADVTDRFFLHAHAVDVDDLPAARRGIGFENLDFAFDANGAMLGSGTRCVATATLPSYPIARIRTGQFSATGKTRWAVDFVPAQGR